MKRLIKLTSLACMIAAASNVMAAGPSANVQVTGTVKMGACAPVMSNDGVSDFGSITVDQITGKTFSRTPTDVSVTVTCGGPTMVGIWITDNRNDSAVSGITGTSDNTILGLGKTAAGDNIGAYVIYMDSWTIDGEPADVIFSPKDDEKSWQALGGAAIKISNQGTPDVVTGALKGTLIPSSFSVMNFSLSTMVVISPNVKSITDVTNLDGNATVNVEYL